MAEKEGDSVNELEPLLEVNTDKVDTEIPAPASGTVLKILAEEGVPAKVGTILAFIGKPGEAVDGGRRQRSANVLSHHPAGPASEKKSKSSTSGDAQLPVLTNREIGFISPVVAKIAAEHGVNLSAGSRNWIQWTHYEK